MSRQTGLKAKLRLYGITPEWANHLEEYDELIRQAVAGGMTLVQYRCKQELSFDEHLARARQVVASAHSCGVPAIINDEPWLAEASGADGVHLGQRDISVSKARDLLGGGYWIGVSVCSVEVGIQEVRSGADYLGVGAIFDASPSKSDASRPRGVEWIRQFRSSEELLEVPIVAIGGIDADNCRSCLEAGADGVAVIRGIFGDHMAGIKNRAHEISERLG